MGVEFSGQLATDTEIDAAYAVVDSNTKLGFMKVRELKAVYNLSITEVTTYERKTLVPLRGILAKTPATIWNANVPDENPAYANAQKAVKTAEKALAKLRDKCTEAYYEYLRVRRNACSDVLRQSGKLIEMPPQVVYMPMH